MPAAMPVMDGGPETAFLPLQQAHPRIGGGELPHQPSGAVRALVHHQEQHVGVRVQLRQTRQQQRDVVGVVVGEDDEARPCVRLGCRTAPACDRSRATRHARTPVPAATRQKQRRPRQSAPGVATPRLGLSGFSTIARCRSGAPWSPFSTWAGSLRITRKLHPPRPRSLLMPGSRHHHRHRSAGR